MKTRMKKAIAVGALAFISLGTAQATPFTTTSPTSGGALSGGVTEVGGLVLDLIGANDVRVISQLSASSLFVGFYDTGSPIAFRGNPGTIGIQSGFGPAVTNALGGGLKEAAIRITLFDGDSAAGNFDFNDNTLLLNGLNFGNWSDVNAQNTNASGTTGFSFSGGGFRNELLDTGWFFSDDATLLSDFFDSLVSTEEVAYQLSDIDPFDNFYDFTQGVDGGLINVGQGPTVTPPSNAVPEPSSIALFGLGLAGLGFRLRNRKK